jgi:hypothetical protein
MLRQLLESFRETQAQRSTEVITEEYMELPPSEDEANVSEANVSEANVSEATGSEANVSEANVSEATGSEANVSEANVSEANVSEANVSEANVSEATAIGTGSESEAAQSEEELQIKCQEITGKPLADLLVTLGECSICLDPIEQLVNVSNTRCGHTFHTHCFLRAIQSGAGNCPNCRSLLLVKEETTDDESDYDESDYDSNEDDDDEDSLVTVRVTLEQTATKLQNLGYSVADILTLYLGTTVRSENPEKYNVEFLIKMNEDLDGILDGSIALSQRDNRSYATAALTGLRGSNGSEI